MVSLPKISFNDNNQTHVTNSTMKISTATNHLWEKDTRGPCSAENVEISPTYRWIQVVRYFSYTSVIVCVKNQWQYEYHDNLIV